MPAARGGSKEYVRVHDMSDVSGRVDDACDAGQAEKIMTGRLSAVSQASPHSDAKRRRSAVGVHGQNIDPNNKW